MSMTFHPRLRAASRSNAASGKRRALHGPEAAGDLRLQPAHTDVLFCLVVADGTDRSCAKRRNSSFLSASPRPDRVRAAASSDPAFRPAQARMAPGPRGGASPRPGSGRRPARSSPGTGTAVPFSLSLRASQVARQTCSGSHLILLAQGAPPPRSRPRAGRA